MVRFAETTDRKLVGGDEQGEEDGVGGGPAAELTYAHRFGPGSPSAAPPEFGPDGREGM